jgi:hypothetical protein
MRFLPSLVLLGAGLLLCRPTKAQRVLLDGNVAADTTRQTFGPNRRVFVHALLGYAPVVGKASGPGADLNYGVSRAVKVGVRAKLRLSEVLAVGADLRYTPLRYNLKQNDQKRLPTPTLHDKESLALQQFETEGWLRLNAGQRGNVIGNYLDLTGWGGWVAGSTHRTEDKPGVNSRRQTSTEHGLSYVRRWTYGVGARIGTGRYALETRYRLSDTFRGSYAAGFPEMPRWVVGIELGVL